ncbi:hypothetical protein MPER_02874 [Moniliophthora perniciosa FA553]|nr:hypothetical protein MPER_02874 [Moniliophthora perniciosa FA553]
MNRLFRHTVTSSDRAAVSQYLLDAEREMKGYDVEINRMKAGILSLENKKSALREKMDKYRSLLAPVHRLPPEILTNIMSISCKSCEIKELETTPPIILSSVCGRWRDIVVSTSSLWSFLSLKFLRWKATDRNLEAARKLHKLTLFFLSRSQTAPLSLILDFSDAETELVDAITTLRNSCWTLEIGCTMSA